MKRSSPSDFLFECFTAFRFMFSAFRFMFPRQVHAPDGVCVAVALLQAESLDHW